MSRISSLPTSHCNQPRTNLKTIEEIPLLGKTSTITPEIKLPNTQRHGIINSTVCINGRAFPRMDFRGLILRSNLLVLVGNRRKLVVMWYTSKHLSEVPSNLSVQRGRQTDKVTCRRLFVEYTALIDCLSRLAHPLPILTTHAMC